MSAVPADIGFDDTVLPQLENALLAGHDVIFLGERPLLKDWAGIFLVAAGVVALGLKR